MVDFVQGQTITPAGQKVIDRLEAGIAEAFKLEESAGVNVLNALSGQYKSYLVNVKKAKTVTPVEWLREYDYGARTVYEQVLAEEQQAEQDRINEEQAAKTSGLADKLDALEQQLKEALAANETLRGDLKAMQEAQTTNDAEDEEEAAEDTEPPARKRNRKAKAQDTEDEQPSGEADAEEAAETEA